MHNRWMGVWVASLMIVFAVIVAIMLTVYDSSDQDKAMVSQEQQETLAIATLAGGCFWCVEQPLEQLPGVVEVVLPVALLRIRLMKRSHQVRRDIAKRFRSITTHQSSVMQPFLRPSGNR